MFDMVIMLNTFMGWTGGLMVGLLYYHDYYESTLLSLYLGLL